MDSRHDALVQTQTSEVSLRDLAALQHKLSHKPTSQQMGKYRDKIGHFELITLSTSRNCPQFQNSEKMKRIFRIFSP